MSKKNTQLVIKNWINHNNKYNDKSWSFDLTAKRIIAWLSNHNLTYENCDEEYRNHFNVMIQKQTNHLINEINKSKLVDDKSIEIIKTKLMNRVSLITPNIPEAEILTNTKINNLEGMIRAAKILINYGAKNVLVKGGHLKSKILLDVLVNKNEIKIFKSKKYTTKNTHGTGCTLSSAITANLSCGKDLIKSCELGIKYVNEAIKSNLNLGKGNGPINHLNSITLNKKFK